MNSKNRTISDNNVTSASKKSVKGRPNWNQFPRVVEDIVDESVSRMKSMKVHEKTKQVNMKTAILDIVRTGNTITNAAELHGLCKSTLGKYNRYVKEKLNDYFEEEADVEFVLKEHNAETLTLTKLLETFKKRRISAPAGVNDVPCTPVESTRKNNNLLCTPVESTRNNNNILSTPIETTRNNSRKRKNSTVASDCSSNAVAASGSSTSAVAASSSSTIATQCSPRAVAPSGSSTTSTQLSLVPVNLEVLPRLMTDQQHAQMLLTRHDEPIQFEGTKDQLHSMFMGELQRYYQGNVSQLASLMTNYVHYEYAVRWQENMFGIPQQLMWAAYNLLARRFQLKNLRITDVDQELAEMEMNVGEGSSSSNWLGQ